MADGLLQLPQAQAPLGDQEDVETLQGAGGMPAIRQRFQVAGALLAEVARVINTDPVGDEYGLVTRNIEEGAASSAATEVAASLVNVTLLVANPRRKMAMFQASAVSTGGTLYLKCGVDATVRATVILVPGAYYELPAPVWKGRIDAVWDIAVGSVTVTELT